MTAQRKPGPAEPIAKIAPKLAELTNEVVFGDIWERPELNKRDRSLITVAALVALSRDELGSHLKRALANGVTPDELVEAITHLAIYASFPNAVSAVIKLAEVLDIEITSA